VPTTLAKTSPVHATAAVRVKEDLLDMAITLLLVVSSARTGYRTTTAGWPLGGGVGVPYGNAGEVDPRGRSFVHPYEPATRAGVEQIEAVGRHGQGDCLTYHDPKRARTANG
jgi:hypothetical protein